MAEHIDYPPLQTGTNTEQLKELYSYLYRTAEKLNRNFRNTADGEVDLSAGEKAVLAEIAGTVKTAEEKRNALIATADGETIRNLLVTMMKILQKQNNTINELGRRVAWLEREMNLNAE